MLILPILSALAASFGWATGIVLAHAPARMLGAFEFTRIQLVAVAAIIGAACTTLDLWPSVTWAHSISFAVSICFGIILGNLAMIECLRRTGPRRTELLLSLKAPLIGLMAFFWLGEIPTNPDMIGAALALLGVFLAIVFGGNPASPSEKTVGSMAIIILLGVSATALQGFGFLVMKPAMLAGTHPIAASAIRLTGAAMVLSVVALWPARAFRPHTQITPSLLGHTILPGFIGYGASSTLLLYAFANLDAGIAAVLGSLSPVLILPILWVKERQPPQFMAVFGAILTILGTAIIVLL